jgi:hypothetical protein
LDADALAGGRFPLLVVLQRTGFTLTLPFPASATVFVLASPTEYAAKGDA